MGANISANKEKFNQTFIDFSFCSQAGAWERDETLK
jgi:hypothetical protein